MKKKLNWTCYTNQPRIEIIEEIKDVISLSDGYIVNFTMFSDLALSLSIEIPEDEIVKLHASLSEIITISPIDTEISFGNSKKDWFVFMNISFSKGKGELMVKTPDVPG